MGRRRRAEKKVAGAFLCLEITIQMKNLDKNA